MLPAHYTHVHFQVCSNKYRFISISSIHNRHTHGTLIKVNFQIRFSVQSNEKFHWNYLVAHRCLLWVFVLACARDSSGQKIGPNRNVMRHLTTISVTIHRIKELIACLCDLFDCASVNSSCIEYISSSRWVVLPINESLRLPKINRSPCVENRALKSSLCCWIDDKTTKKDSTKRKKREWDWETEQNMVFCVLKVYELRIKPEWSVICHWKCHDTISSATPMTNV